MGEIGLKLLSLIIIIIIRNSNLSQIFDLHKKCKIDLMSQYTKIVGSKKITVQ